MTDQMTPQQKGRWFEEFFSKRIKGHVVPGSGSGFSKLDVRGNKMVFSLKHTENRSFRVDDDLFLEIHDAIYKPGGYGADHVGALIVRTANRTVAALSADDLLLILDRLRNAEKRAESAEATLMELGTVPGKPVDPPASRKFASGRTLPKGSLSSRRFR